MSTSKWTVLLFRGDADKIRQYSLPPRAVRPVLVSLCVGVTLFVCAAVFLAYDTGARARASLLARENRLLEAELEGVQTRLAGFDREIATLAEKDRRVRALAGKMGIDEEVFEVGVGGPGLDSPEEGELWVLDPEASELAYATRYDLSILERKVDLLNASFEETESSLEDQKERLEATPSILPTGGVLSSPFSTSRFHPIHRRLQPHEGIDQLAPTGTPIVATGGGVVEYAGYKFGYGNTVVIDHGFGISTLYGHASRLLVTAGKRVRRAEVVAQVGCTGECTAPHVHYEVHVDSRPVNPLRYVLRLSVP